MRTGIPLDGWSVGQKLQTRGRTVSETEIVNFVTLVGYNEGLFLNMEYLKERGHERRMAPALLTCALADCLIVQTGTMHDYAIALLGIDGLVAQAPVYAGDTLTVEVEVTEVRPSRSKPDRGVLGTHQRVYNQKGALVLEYDVKRMLRRETPA